jgi:hypothetical protein
VRRWGEKKEECAKIGHYRLLLMPAGARKYAFWQFAKPLLNDLIVLAI